MDLNNVAAASGFGFVTLAVVINVVYVRAGPPLTVSSGGLREMTDDLARSH